MSLILDTKDMPTEQGSRICKGTQPGVDASIVGLLRAAGASIIGKTVSPFHDEWVIILRL
jgi:Asp-tRNA(Asn)/Glu-tRNA(Gln) amidotransferase A subunit family amidase